MAIGFKAVAQAPTTFNGGTNPSRILAHGDEIVVGGTTLRCSVSVAGRSDEDDDDNAAASSSSEAVKSGTNAVGELVFISGTAKDARIPLGDDQIILGTRADCTFGLNDPLVSSMHCAISKAGDEFVATDLRSTNGTFINGTRITTGTALHAGDLIALGGHVLEARLLGGVAQAVKGKTVFMTMGPGGIPTPKPRFVIDGRVASQKKLVLGRAPSCDIIVDDPATSREHCAIEWDAAAFYVADTSSHGTYVDDKRVVKQPLAASCVLRIGNSLFRVAVRGEVCTIERTDAALAQAAVDVARAQASRAQAKDPSSISAASGGPIVSPMKTVFRLDGAQLEQEIASRKKDLQRNAPAWRPSSDLSREAGLRGAVVLAVIGAIALCGATLALAFVVLALALRRRRAATT
jgi:pSer/pThr/pTyr-binding forkhead associated (FHA) protein